jgi:hypothetical protein
VHRHGYECCIECCGVEAFEVEEVFPDEVHELVVDDLPLVRTAPVLEVIPHLDELLIGVLAVEERSWCCQGRVVDLFLEQLRVPLQDFLLAHGNVVIPHVGVESVECEVAVQLPVIVIKKARVPGDLSLRPAKVPHPVVIELQGPAGDCKYVKIIN